MTKQREQRIVPTRGASFVTANETKRMLMNFAHILPETYLRNLCASNNTNNIDSFLRELNVQDVSINEFVESIDHISHLLDIDTRIKLIEQVQNERWRFMEYTPDLLTDEMNKPIPCDENVWLAPQGTPLKLPEWLKINILNKDLTNKLVESLGVRGATDLPARLTVYDLKEYRISNLASAIIDEGEDLLIRKGDGEEKIRIDIIQTLWDLFERSDAEELSKLPQRIKVKILTRKGDFKDANTLYFGKEYSGGFLTEELYGAVCADRLIASPDVLRIKGDENHLVNFFKWLGVENIPRLRNVEVIDEDFKRYVISNLKYPATFEPADLVISDVSQMQKRSYKLEGVMMIRFSQRDFPKG